MTPVIPLFSQGACIDPDFVRQQAAVRQLPLGQEQRRDSQGQFQSHKDLPDTARRDSARDNVKDDQQDK